MEYTSHPRQTVLLSHSHSTSALASAPISSGSESDPTNSATLPFPFPPSASASTSTPPTSTPAPVVSSPALPAADDAMSDAVPAPAPAAPATRGGRGRGRGRGSARGRGRVAKPAQPKTTSGRGRRQKMYESARCQAAHERMQELKSAYAAVAKAVKPVALEIADQSLAELTNNPDVFKQVPEYEQIQSFLKERLDDTKSAIDMERDIESRMLDHLYAGQQEITHNEFNASRCLAAHCDDRYDQLMLQLDILEDLYNNNLPVDLPAPDNEEYLVKAISQKQADEQGPYVVTKDGIEVPFPGTSISDLVTKAYQLPEDIPLKRKAEDEPEGQPESKLTATAEGGETVPAMPRHASGLLSAVDAMDSSRASTPGESSNTSTPAPEPVDAGGIPTSVQPAPRHALEIPLPRFTTGPDEYGVRIVTRKATRLDVPNNRIMVPNTFDWDDLDIGFRDSTNSVQKGATKAKRGRYLGQPNSNFMFLDRRVGTWDSTQSAGQFDETLIRKFGLHPTMGLVLPTSNNVQEPPQPHVSGWKPTVLVSPSGQRIHASRTIPPARQDRKVCKMYRRLQLKNVVGEFCEKEGIPTSEIAPTPDEREGHRRAVLWDRGLDPDKITVPAITPGVTPSMTPAPSPPHDTEPAPAEDTTGFGDFVQEALAAASSLEAEEQSTRAASVKPITRPYDAIRDVFTDTSSAPPTPTSLPAKPVDASEAQNLFCLADICETMMNMSGVQSTYPGIAPEYTARQQPYEQGPPADMGNPLAYPSVEHPAHESARPSDFMRTALNPPAMVTPSLGYQSPAGYQSPSSMGSQSMAAPEYPSPQGPNYQPMTTPEYPNPPVVPSTSQGSGRTPFANPAPAKALPALRPIRGFIHSETPPLPDPHGSPVPQHHIMVPSNTGSYYPPAPHRPFHNGYSLEPAGGGSGGVHGLQHPMMTHGPGPLQPPSMMPADHHRGGTYSLSPPPYHHPIAPSPGSRPGSSSGGSNAKFYRKLEPAPTPPHRMGYGGGGNGGQELRTVQFDYREAIKDYTPVEAPPRHGPTHVRGWSHNNLKKARGTGGGRGEEE
ncbi:hypothetical protein QBC39DRAFT_419006 [Podospora conica]|nr:hypothetical protein QBC39DRAFT_419006 [Schizothecium conicum]